MSVKRILPVLPILISILLFSGCTPQPQQLQQRSKNITICAAASLRDALSEIQPNFEKDTGIKLTMNFASSGALQKQIEEGAPADVFISAGKKQMDALESQNLIDKESRKNLLGNKLVLVVPDEYRNEIKTVSDLVDKDVKISIGEPDSVPAGQYAKDTLLFLDLWDKLASKIVYAKDVKQVVAYVESGEIAAGIVYNSDATILKNSTIAQLFEENTHKPIVYPEAIISASKEKETAKAFCDYLNKDSVRQIFRKYGFDTDIE
jgi:molybdate transport system substrate-binding protein